MKTVLISIVLICGTLYCAEIVKKHSDDFNRKENGYVFSFQFQTCLPCDSILAILYDINHFKKYSSQESDIKLLRKEGNSYDVEFKLKYLMYVGKSVYRRTLDTEAKTVRIKMLKFEHNSNLVPKLTDSDTEYRVFSRDGQTIVMYTQNVTFGKKVSWFVIKMIKVRLNSFENELVKYVTELEK
jgi:hypothetical protein